MGVLLALASCRGPGPIPAPTAQRSLETANAFVGNEECRECHPAIFDEHRGSRHDATLRTMDRESLGAQAPAPGKIPDSPYTLTAMEDGGYGFGLDEGPKHKLELVFGSGKSGMAFASIPGEGMFAEARMSYYPPTRRWFITPGQQGISDRAIGNMMQGKAGRQCLECHTVSLSLSTLRPEKRYFGVGCESCHGPGQAHVTAARAGDSSNLRITRLSTLGGKAMNDLCGRCHRTQEAVAEKNLGDKHTNLFQAHGLAKSACFQKSSDRLTCMTCHQPHSNVSLDESTYVKACLTCHNAAASASNPKVAPAGVCPVDSKEKCVSCHMPRIPEPLFPGQPRRIADHYIRIHRALNR